MTRLSASAAFCSASLAVLTVACAGTVSAPGATSDAEPAFTTSAVVVVQRMVDSTQGFRAEASARFVRVLATSSTQDALRAIGASVDLPARGACSRMAALAGGVVSGLVAPSPQVELLDVGSVSVETGAVETRLLPRQLPDVTDVVSGVVYARSADSLLLPAQAPYVLHVEGHTELAPFDVAASAPGDPADVRVAGEEVTGAQIVVAAPYVEFAWPIGQPSDVIYLDIQPTALRCVLAATAVAGDPFVHAELSATVFGDQGELVLHRLRREPLHAWGLEGGELRFDFSRSVLYTRR